MHTTPGEIGGSPPPLHPLFNRYPKEKMDRFQDWLQTRHGVRVYYLFTGFACQWRDNGQSKCGANLIGNRIRWEMQVDGGREYKVPNDYLPMMARQLVVDDATFTGFFNFHRADVELITTVLPLAGQLVFDVGTVNPQTTTGCQS